MTANEFSKQYYPSWFVVTNKATLRFQKTVGGVVRGKTCVAKKKKEAFVEKLASAEL